jgi:hypothetical protein
MPRIMRHIHEYYENRIVWGFNFTLIDDELSPGKKAIKISIGGGVVNNELVETIAPKILRASDFIVETDGVPNKLARTDIIVLDTAGAIYVVKGAPGTSFAPTPPELALQMAHVSIKAGFNNFVGEGVNDEIICLRSEHVIDTRFVPPA